MFDAALAAVEGALAAGARYADARLVSSRRQDLTCLNGDIEALDTQAEVGVGVRALCGGGWGFAAVSDPGLAAARAAGARATALSSAAAGIGSAPGEPALAAVPPQHGSWRTPVVEDPFAVPLSEKCDLLLAVTGALRAERRVDLARAWLACDDAATWFVSSEGHRISQVIVHSGGGMEATAVGEEETQRRSYPQAGGQYASGGYEVVRAMDLVGNAPRVAAEAAALLQAPHCPSGVTDVILEASQVALQIHESVGHATEGDRILGWEASLAGTSFLDPRQLGRLRYGSELMNIVADATLPGALGSFGYDDEGTPAQAVEIVHDGIWVGALTGRDSAPLLGLPAGGMVVGAGHAGFPMVRMTNVSLQPGPHRLDDVIADTDDGLYLATNRSWSIDDKRLNFQFGCEAAWEVKGGRLGRLVRNPTYTGITPRFWASMDRVAGAGPGEWAPWGLPTCGKGHPPQAGNTGHGAAAARFRNVRVGVTSR
jgi:TldD protein